MPVHAHFIRLEILTIKLGQIDLVLVCHQGLVSRFVRARLQVSVCSGCSLYHPGKHPDRQHLTSLYEKLSQLS